MFLPIFVLILFVVLGGVIAVVADNVGRKLGKKRLKLWNLRPKHTAQLGTFIVGALISLFTIALIFFASSDVRRWITEGNQAVQQRDDARAELAMARSDLQGLEGRNAQLDKDYQAKAAQANQQAERLERLQKQIGEIEPQIARLTTAVASADRERKRAQTELASRQAELATARKNLLDVEQRRKVQEASAMAAAEDKKVTDTENQRLTVLNADLEREQARVQLDIDRLTRETKNLELARDRAQEELENAQEELQEYQTQLIEAGRELTARAADLQKMTAAANRLAGGSSTARVQPIMYEIGEEVTRVGVDARVSVTQAQDILMGLLRSARIEAIARGAKRTEERPEAGLIPQSDPVTQKDVPEEQVERQIVQQIAGSPSAVVVVAYSSLNSFRGEPVFLDVQVLPNPMVYAKGQLIAESRVDGSRDETSILRELEELFSVAVRERARQDRMIPKMGSNEFGEVEPADVYRLLGQVKDANRQVRVQAVALEDTRAGDPLRLEFRIR